MANEHAKPQKKITEKTLAKELARLKARTGWSWEKLSREFQRVMGQPGPSMTTIFRYASRSSKRRNLVVERYVREAMDRLALETEEKQQENEARRKHDGPAGPWKGIESEIRRLLENANDIIFCYRLLPERKMDYISPAIFQHLGYRPADYYQDPDLPMKSVHPDDRHILESTFVGEPIQPLVTMRFRHKNGFWVWLERTTVPLRDQEGRTIAVYGISRNVSERKRREAEQAFLAAIVESSEEAILSTDRDGIILSWNLGAERLFGYTATEIVGQHTSVLHPPEHPDRQLKLAQLEQGGFYLSDTVRMTKAGKKIHISLRISPVKIDNELVGFSGIARGLDRERGFDRALREIVAGTSRSVGTDFFRALVRHLAKSLDVHYAFIGKSLSKEETQVLAAWEGTGYGANLKYKIRGTPCEEVFSQNRVCITRKASERFPDDQFLQDRRIESYLAVPILDKAGNPIGHLGIMHDVALVDHFPREAILQIFAARAAAEIERIRLPHPRHSFFPKDRQTAS